MRNTIRAGSSGVGLPLTTTLITVVAGGGGPVPTAIAITLFDENSDSAIDSKDLGIALQSDSDDDDSKEEAPDKPKRTIAEVRKIFRAYCAQFPNNGGRPESCSWTAPQFVEYYTGNWTEYCGGDIPQQTKSKSPSKAKCRKCNPDRGINKRDSVCLRLLFFAWPAEFGTMALDLDLLPTPTRGLHFPQRVLGKHSSGAGAVFGGSVWVVGAAALGCVLVGEVLGIF